MKRLIVAGFLGLIIVFSLVFSIFYVKHICKETRTLLNECIEAYDKTNKSYYYADKLNNYWEKAEKNLSFIVNHDRLDEIESAIGSLKDYSDTKENEIFYEYSGTVDTLIHQLLEDTVPGVHSIF